MATGYSNSAPTVSTMADLYEKTNTNFKIGVNLMTPEAKWFKQYPTEKISVSGNENRIPLLLTKPVGVNSMPDGGYEGWMTSPAPTHGTFLLTQMNHVHGYTGLAMALSATHRSAMIEEQTDFQAMTSISAISNAIGLQTYGQSTGTLAVIAATTSATATQTDVQLKNAWGTTNFPGTASTAQKTHINLLVRTGEHVALIRSGSIVEFGTVIASPAVSAGVGYVDITFTSSITPTVGDLLVLANAAGDSTITGTDVNNWAIGFTEILFATSLHGVSGTTYPGWTAASNQTTTQRFSFAVKEKMANDIMNASGMVMDKMVVSQGVRRDAIAGGLGSRRYNGSTVDLEGDLDKFDYLTAPLTPPGFAVGWYSKALAKVEASEQPTDGSGKSIFKIDKVQGRSQVAAYYDYFYQKVCGSRGAVASAINLTES